MKKGWIFGIVVGVLLLAIVSVAVVAAGVGGEASKMDTLMKDDLQQHKSVADVQKQLADAGYTIQEQTPKLKAVGPNHSLVVYSTHLTLDLGFDESGKMISYHLDRA